MPILMNLYLSKNIYLSVGPEVAYRINAKVKTKNISKDISDFYEKEELSGLMGINYKWKEKVDIGLRYNQGISYVSTIRLTDELGLPNGETSREYNQYVQWIVRFQL